VIKINWVKTVLLLLISTMLVACSGISVRHDYEKGYNFSGLKTFAWLSTKDKEYGIKDNELVDKRIRAAIESKLSERSYQLIDSTSPDFFVSYHLTVEQKLTSSGVSGGVSLGRSSHGRYGGVGMSTGSQVKAYDQATLLIDFTEPGGDKLIWRGISTQSVSISSGPEESTAIISETVEKVLSQFPPEK
jgi:hypothetical protein